MNSHNSVRKLASAAILPFSRSRLQQGSRLPRRANTPKTCSRDSKPGLSGLTGPDRG